MRGGSKVVSGAPCMLWQWRSLDFPPCAGEMSDAGEVLGEILNAVSATRGAADLVDACFGLHVSERVVCATCGQKPTHVNEYTELIFTVSATAVMRQLRVRIPETNCLPFLIFLALSACTCSS